MEELDEFRRQWQHEVKERAASVDPDKSPHLDGSTEKEHNKSDHEIEAMKLFMEGVEARTEWRNVRGNHEVQESCTSDA